MLSIVPVLELPYAPEKWPWPTADGTPGAMLPLEPASLECLGSFMSAILRGEGPVCEMGEAMARLREADGFVAGGGLRISGAGIVLRPGCCCGLEGWPEWEAFLRGGFSPWMGHDPGPWAELRDGSVSLWVDLEQAATAVRGPSICVPVAEFERALNPALDRIQDFLGALPRWFESVQQGHERELWTKVWQSFSYRRGA